MNILIIICFCFFRRFDNNLLELDVDVNAAHIVGMWMCNFTIELSLKIRVKKRIWFLIFTFSEIIRNTCYFH